MQTKQQIQTLLACEGVEPNKKLGQHFLIDMNLLELMTKNAAITKKDIVLEIGTGTGTLTEELVKKAAKVVAVEYDETMVKITQNIVKKMKNVKNFTLIHDDALENKNKINQKIIDEINKAKNNETEKIMLVANLPYNIASPVMINLLTGTLAADTMVVTVQKEVADRMAAKTGSDDYGTLSIIMGAMGKTKLIRKLPPTVFWPRPQVDSAMIRFDRDNKKCNSIQNIKIFKKVVAMFMTHRRKMMRACTKFANEELADINNWNDIFDQAKIKPENRPENISPEKYVEIANLCCSKML